jgi:hypothetical protein
MAVLHHNAQFVCTTTQSPAKCTRSQSGINVIKIRGHPRPDRPPRHAVLDDSPEVAPVLLVIRVLVQGAENPVGQVLEIAPVEVETKQTSTVDLTISPLRGIISPADVPR